MNFSQVDYSTNKRKIINDPVYGFINIPGDFIFDLIQHPWVQRLRNIKQLGLTNYVYPGATHTRFQHCLGALHLMDMALQTLKAKGVAISPEEEEAALIAILLHDAGHGPFSHALEKSIIKGITHEDMSLLLMNMLNSEFKGRLSLAIDIFTGNYRRKFFHQLITGQTDMDRLDYLRRDSFYTGVIEGSVGSDRIIRMLNVANDQLAIEEKGIYSLEKLLIARRLMYWQVYMHKTVLSTESLLVNVLRRAKEIALKGEQIYSTPSLSFFLYNEIGRDDITGKGRFPPAVVAFHFTRLDDSDIFVSARYWSDHSDRVLSDLSARLIRRNLFAVELQNKPFFPARLESIRKRAGKILDIEPGKEDYYVFSGKVSNLAYATDGSSRVKILLKNGDTAKIEEVSDIFGQSFLSERIIKYFLCYPKECR